MPTTKYAVVVTSPSVSEVAPTATSSGHRLGRAVACAAADVAKASWSIADTFESRMKTLMPARNDRATAAEISPIVPSAPPCSDAVGHREHRGERRRSRSGVWNRW